MVDTLSIHPSLHPSALCQIVPINFLSPHCSVRCCDWHLHDCPLDWLHDSLVLCFPPSHSQMMIMIDWFVHFSILLLTFLTQDIVHRLCASLSPYLYMHVPCLLISKHPTTIPVNSVSQVPAHSSKTPLARSPLMDWYLSKPYSCKPSSNAFFSHLIDCVCLSAVTQGECLLEIMLSLLH